MRVGEGRGKRVDPERGKTLSSFSLFFPFPQADTPTQCIIISESKKKKTTLRKGKIG